jgi:ribose transport system ATP-binding protein
VSSEVALAVAGLSKAFGATRALDGVDLLARRGQIHALVGGNGSGKSTLIKVLAGVHRGEPGGTIRVGEYEVAADDTSPDLARRAGLRFVHQDPGVFGNLTVAENLAIGGAPGFPTRAGTVRWRALRRRAARLLERFEIDARPDDRLEDLRQVERTMIAIARALADEDDSGASTVLVLDEPTASLPEHEVETVLTAIRRCASAGQSVVYVSHRLGEVLALADAITVLRDGRVVVTSEAAGMTTEALIEAIVGRPLDRVFADHHDAPEEETLLEVSGLAGGPLSEVSFTLRRGEVVGIAGLLGSGRTELLRMLFGAEGRRGGLVTMGGALLDPRSPAEAMQAGVAFVPEDRVADAAFSDLSVKANLSIARLDRYSRGLRLRKRDEKAEAERSIAAFSVRCPGPEAPLSELSGGNQQKVILARWLERAPKLLLLDEPTQGVDIGARAELYAAIRAATDRGMGAVLVSSDFEELAHAADRALVLRDGRISAEVPKRELSARRLTDLLYVEEPA